MKVKEILKLHNQQWESQKPKKEKPPVNKTQQAADVIKDLVKK